MTELEKQINLVVEARAKAGEAKTLRLLAFEEWEHKHEGLFLAEKEFGAACAFEESQLREMAVKVFGETGDKQVAPGVGIRVRTVLNYESKDAMEWAVKHELALKLDPSAFEKIAKTSNLSFVTITEEPTATIAAELQKVEE